MRIAAELGEHAAAGSLAEELPWWGWLADGRTCLTRSGELVACGRLSPAVTDGRSAEEIDRVLGSWQRLLSGLGAETRLSFHLLRRPLAPGEGEGGGAGITALSGERRRAFLAGRVQRLEAFVVWAHDPGLGKAAGRPGPGPAGRLAEWWRRRKGAPAAYLAREIEAAAGRFRGIVDAGRALVGGETPVRILGAAEGSRFLSELVNRPGTAWAGATGSRWSSTRSSPRRAGRTPASSGSSTAWTR